MRTLLLLLLAAVLAAPAPAATGTIRPERLMVLVIGPTSDPITPVEEDVVRRLNSLRKQQALEQLQLGTMHWDQPPQAQLAQQKLGIRRTDLVAVALVELDDRRIPKRALYKLARVTPQSLDEGLQALQRWSELTGIPVSLDSTSLDEPPVRNETMTAEGMLATARRLETLSSGLWDKVRNEPVRKDGSDKAVRRALLGLAENSRLLRIAFEQGRVKPTEQFELVLASGREFTAAEPQYNLPVAYRPSVPPIMEALAGIRQAWQQLNR